MAHLVVRNLSLSYPIYGANSMSLKSSLLKIATGGHFKTDRNLVTVEALKGVDFELREGDSLGLIGHNGAGKSTLLRVLAGIYAPTQGEIQVEGRVDSFLDVSFGFEEDATGYENIRLRGLLRGLKKGEISQLVQDVTEFTDLGNFLSLPIRTYSSGMRARLAFAISTATPPEILLLDEAIDTGDMNFIEKAQERMHRFIERAKILVFASHNLETLKGFCNQGLWLVHGEAKAFGPIEETIDLYTRSAHPERETVTC